ncbi:TetR/AcrR family transcriptional regulator [Nocardioides carbamazepini]|uniref:TetR/AcrR family transcriptional regulator n=1 Tax=Nocardioides carbamazepini TaxID=2854259 RepID=UPI002149B833|nr:TetR/AcrR family transcriptional regulator [Nocardioides carbamazepini]MCR1781302.1 TetR/AcrR family transcriptional regulator [Nocardioides carbamazepini]
MPTADPETRRGRPLAGGVEQVREGATRLFARQGYSGTNMKDIGHELGVQAPSLYNYVDSKQQILDEVVLAYTLGLRDAIASGLSLADDPVEQARRGIEEQSRFKLGHHEAMVVADRDALHLSEPVARRLSDCHDEIRELWSGVIRRGIDQGKMSSADVDVAVEILVDLAGPRQVRALSAREGVSESKLAYWFGDAAVQLLTTG